MKPTNEEMRAHIAQLMIHGDWHGGTSRKELAEQWGVAERTVGDRALEASRAIGLNRDIKGWVDEKIQQLEQDAALARSLGKPRDAAYCIELQAKLLGAMAPVKRQEMPADDYDKLTAAERIAKHREAIAEEEAKLGEKDGMH